ncbi:hypothetical protein NQ318_006902 [Aromia moschata]|uniref:Ig-like domain-containing protein n=1 Tax=Aromia moschata TaxID=1265417 RepID=A0AAV8XND2_9CUCU|nr:hypothetical protein NQ318_006902 [Aromia moschata]
MCLVSWIRSRDLHILTSGRHTFTGDGRFESVHSDSSGDFWGLRIRGAFESDTGRYECQVNTEPKMSLAITLTVMVKKGELTKFKNTLFSTHSQLYFPNFTSEAEIRTKVELISLIHALIDTR